MKKENVIKNIRSAFSFVVLGQGIGLWEAQAIDDYESKEVQEINRNKDEKQDWSLLDADELQRCHSSLSFFDAEGMRFHLPAFLVNSLEGKTDDPIFHLTRLDDYAVSKLTALNTAQRNSIVMYLNWCLEQDEYEFDHPGIKRALSEYWNI